MFELVQVMIWFLQGGGGLFFSMAFKTRVFTVSDQNVYTPSKKPTQRIQRLQPL